MNPTPADPLIGTTVSQYEIVAKLGGGGMGVVYKARDTKLGRAVALKFLPPQWSHDEGAKQRFVREAQAASATNHRNICVIHNIEETPDGRLFIVMAHYEGETLKQKLERGPLPIAEAIEIASEVAEGLARAHAQGVVHRDVKPGNLMITDDGVKILDFGLAKFADALQLTVPGSTLGTVAYMSPEQTRGEEADLRSDVWAFGIVMYEMLAGSVPFKGTYPEAIFHAIKNEPLPSLHAARLDTPDSLERIVMKALERDPERRFQTAREPARELRLLAGRTVPLELRTEELPTLAAFPRERVTRKSWIRRTVTPTRFSAAATLLLAGAVGWYVWMTRAIERIRIAIVPVANHTGNTELDQYRLALTSALIDEISESPNIRVVPYLRLVEMIRPFMAQAGDVSSNEAIQRIAADSGAPFLVVPTLVYRDRDATWLVQIQVRNAATGTTVASYETAPVTSSLSQQTAFRLTTTAADSIQQHFKITGPRRPFQPRAMSSRFREPGAARAFAEGLTKYDELEYSAALAALTEAARLDDQHALTHAWLSRVYGSLNRKNEAVAAAQRARSLVTGDAPKTDAAFVGAILAEGQGDIEAAEKGYRQLVALESDNPWALTELADFLKRRQDRNQAAIETYHRVLGLDSAYIRPHVELCQLYTRIDDHPLAEKEARLAVERYQSLHTPSGEAQALLCLGESEREQGGEHLAEARRNVEAARAAIESIDQPYNLSRAVFYLGLVEISDGRLRESSRLFEEAVGLTHAVGNKVTEGIALMNLGVANALLGQPTPGMEFFRRSRDVFLEVGDERRVAEADVNLAGLQIDYGGDPDAALKTLDNARVNLERLGHIDFQLLAMQSEADAHRNAGRLAQSQRLMQAAREIATKNDLQDQVAGLGLNIRLALADLHSNEYEKARVTLARALDGATAGIEPDVRIAYGTVLTRLADFATAKTTLERAVTDAEAQQRLDLLPQAHAALGELALELKDPSLARMHFDAAVRSWADPLPSSARGAARCARGFQDAVRGRRDQGRRDLESGLAEAGRTRRLAVVARCRIQLAHVDLLDGRMVDATGVLNAIPDDTPDVTIGPELRAQVEHLRGLASVRSGRTAGDHRRRAREIMLALQLSLPREARERFAGRLDIGAILQGPVQTQP